MKPESQVTLAKKAAVLEVTEGQWLFEVGEELSAALFLLEGAVQLIDANQQVLATVLAGSPEAAHRLVHQAPRKVSVRVTEPSKVLAIKAMTSLWLKAA